MNNVTFLFVCFCLSVLIGGNSVLGQSHLSLIPQPVEVSSQSGTFSLSVKTHIIIPSGNPEIREIAGLFAGQLSSLTGKSLEITTGKAKQSVVFKLNNEANTRLGNEGYLLQVSPQNITISANKPAGLFYGAQTFLQLVPPAKASSVAIPCAEITDYPRFGWRGLMLDVSRHFFTKDEVKRFIDQMVKYKYNTFHWHLTDDNDWRVEIKAYPKLTSIGVWSVARTGRYGSFEPEQPGEPDGIPMLYNTKPVLSSSDWYFANWVRDHVQWEVLAVFSQSSANGIYWDEIDPEIDWMRYYRGITHAAIRWLNVHTDQNWRPHNIPETYDSYRRGAFDYCFPDTHNSVTGNYGGMFIPPVAIADNI